MFYDARAFNGDLSQWDVAKVTTMQSGKSISILEKDCGLCVRCLDYVLCVRCLDFVKCPDFVLGVWMLF